MAKQFKRVLVAMDSDTLCEAVYVDGVYHSCDQTIYAGVLVTIAEGQPFRLFYKECQPLSGDEWPLKESKLIEVVEE